LIFQAKRGGQNLADGGRSGRGGTIGGGGAVFQQRVNAGNRKRRNVIGKAFDLASFVGLIGILAGNQRTRVMIKSALTNDT
jgi:hypothetical protein